MKYQIGDVIQLASMWDNQIGLVMDINEDVLFCIYHILIPSEHSPVWLSESAIVSRLY